MKNLIPGTEERVEESTAEEINERIGRDIEARVGFYAERQNLIQNRLNEIDREWDIERTLEMNAAALSVLGIVLGVTKSRKWLTLPTVVGSFLLQHAIQGWCPPVPLFRRLGIRTTREINREKYALKALRGDFDNVNSQSDDRPGMKAQTVLSATTDKKAS